MGFPLDGHMENRLTSKRKVRLPGLITLIDISGCFVLCPVISSRLAGFL